MLRNICVSVLMSIFIYIYSCENQKINVNVYVIDSPIDIYHQEFGGRAKYAIDPPICYDPVKNTKWLNSDHGTHIAGIIGGNTVGMTTNVMLHSIGIIDCHDRTDILNLVNAIQWVIENHESPAIINLSLIPNDPFIFKELDDVIEKAIKAGIIVIASAGNDATDRCHSSPLTAHNIIIVGSISQVGVRSTFSNYGDCVTVYAYGEEIKSSISNNFYVEMSGTSQSTPRVTGIIAEYISKYGIKSQTEIRNYLQTLSINKNIFI